VESGRFLWNVWLNDPRNEEFMRLYQSKPEGTRIKLEMHLMQPFRLMDEITQEWDFDTASVSVYQYTSFLVRRFFLMSAALRVSIAHN